MSEIKYLVISPSNLDDLFMYKFKIEEMIAKEANKEVEHIKLDEFINNCLQMHNHVFYCDATQDSVAFSLKEIGNERICFYTSNQEATIKAFRKAFNEINGDLSKLGPEIRKSDYEMVEGKDFWLINGKMLSTPVTVSVK